VESRVSPASISGHLISGDHDAPIPRWHDREQCIEFIPIKAALDIYSPNPQEKRKFAAALSDVG